MGQSSDDVDDSRIATIARLRTSKVDNWPDGGLNAEAELLNAGADIILPNGDDKDSRCVQAISDAYVYNLLIDAHGIRSCVEGHDTHQELTCKTTSTSPAPPSPRGRPVDVATAAATLAAAVARAVAARSVTRSTEMTDRAF